MTAGQFLNASAWSGETTFDVCVVGSGPGGSIVAALLAQSGAKVVVLEEGGHYTKADFKLREDLAFPQLYQEAGGRQTKDGAIAILQGRSVGGGSTLNWTTSFRTPSSVVEHWAKHHAVGGVTTAELTPHWEAVEQRLNIHKIGLADINRNNRVIWDGCKALGYQVDTTRRNVRGCVKSGFCGMGCAIDAKQAMGVTYLPDAVAAGAVVLSRCRVDRLAFAQGRLATAECSLISEDNYNETGRKLTIRAKRFVLAAGAINTPGILIRSGLGGGLVGKRTWLHPAVGVSARFKEPVEPFYGAPQSVTSHQFADRGDEVGYFIETAPMHPMLAAICFTMFGKDHAQMMKDLPHFTTHIALMIDGFHDDEPGGTVDVLPSGAPRLDYSVVPSLWSAIRDATKTLARINLAAGAEYVMTGHDPPLRIDCERDLARVDSAPFAPNRVNLYTAHQLGGSTMSDDPKRGVVRSWDLRHHRIENLHVVDGSVFPTGLGVNPQESIYGLAHLMASRFVSEWKS